MQKKYKGTSFHLKEDVYMLFIFMDDDESRWDSQSISDYWYNHIEKATDFIEKWANQYGYKIKIHKGHYATGYESLHMKYKGNSIIDLFKEDPGNAHMKQAISCLGYDNLNAFHQYISTFSQQKQVAYAVVFNKEGVSYCTSDNEEVNGDYFQYAVLFRSYIGVDGGVESTIAHETLHLFGAQDYYDPFKNFPKRANMAEQLCPNDIMLKVYKDLNYNEINDFTAYSVGWLDEIPAQYNKKEWWE